MRRLFLRNRSLLPAKPKKAPSLDGAVQSPGLQGTDPWAVGALAFAGMLAGAGGGVLSATSAFGPVQMPGGDLPEEVRANIERKRLEAMERKRKREEQERTESKRLAQTAPSGLIYPALGAFSSPGASISAGGSHHHYGGCSQDEIASARSSQDMQAVNRSQQSLSQTSQPEPQRRVPSLPPTAAVASALQAMSGMTTSQGDIRDSFAPVASPQGVPGRGHQLSKGGVALHEDMRDSFAPLSSKQGAISGQHASAAEPPRVLPTYMQGIKESQVSALGLPSNSSKVAPELSIEQQTVLGHALRGKNIFITGCGGTGKSFLMHTVIKELRGRYGESKVAVTATTGALFTISSDSAVHEFTTPHYVRTADESGVVFATHCTSLRFTLPCIPPVCASTCFYNSVLTNVQTFPLNSQASRQHISGERHYTNLRGSV